MALLLAACAARPAGLPHASALASVTSAPLAASPCENRFVASALDHTTTVTTKIPGLYESNGAGLAIGDLDGDGRQDIVLANLAGPNTILWNQGDLRFRTERLGGSDAVGASRGATIVDVDGDGRNDIVFSQRMEKPAWWRNTPQGFVRQPLPDVNNPFYTLTWADVDGDGALDLIASSYDTELAKAQGLIFQQRGGGVGAFVYTRSGPHFVSHQLTKQADTLAIALPDIDGDGRPDLWFGNDFNRPDDSFTLADGGWQRSAPSANTSENTMSLDLGDVNNDGVQELFASDMKPVDKSTATMAKWLPMMKRLTKPLTSSDPQHAENTLLFRSANGRWHDEGYERMVDSTGWSWSAKFGDLDSDGWLDLYVVNGMIAQELFEYLPNSELVEHNVALHNDGNGQFHAAPAWGLGSTSSGRGMSMADLDGDGDLDIVVNNLTRPAQLFENRLCGGANLLVDLRSGQPLNRAAIGAVLTLRTSAGTFTRDVRAASGYLSGDPSQIHFGIPAGAHIERLDVRWPDGALTVSEGLSPQTSVAIAR